MLISTMGYTGDCVVDGGGGGVGGVGWGLRVEYVCVKKKHQEENV